jgi:hypothetical protein
MVTENQRKEVIRLLNKWRYSHIDIARKVKIPVNEVTKIFLKEITK